MVFPLEFGLPLLVTPKCWLFNYQVTGNHIRAAGATRLLITTKHTGFLKNLLVFSISTHQAEQSRALYSILFVFQLQGAFGNHKLAVEANGLEQTPKPSQGW